MYFSDHDYSRSQYSHPSKTWRWFSSPLHLHVHDSRRIKDSLREIIPDQHAKLPLGKNSTKEPSKHPNPRFLEQEQTCQWRISSSRSYPFSICNDCNDAICRKHRLLFHFESNVMVTDWLIFLYFQIFPWTVYLSCFNTSKS